MNILVINGSPKGEKSNSMKLTRAFLNGAGWTNVETVDVSKSDIKGCLGCYTCWTKTPGKCVINDSMRDILKKFIFADIIILSFGLYGCHVPGNLKNLMDRQIPLMYPEMKEDGHESGEHPTRIDLSKKRHIIISTCGFWTDKGNYDALTWILNRGFGENQYETIFCGQGELFSIPELNERTNRYLEIVRNAGIEYSKNGVISEKIKEELSETLFPKDEFEKMANGSWE
ncbi:MAG: flavodoxin family protein [Treponema sp.]|nr:flavodoxin family protein [Treponema sp.]